MLNFLHFCQDLDCAKEDTKPYLEINNKHIKHITKTEITKSYIIDIIQSFLDMNIDKKIFFK